MKVGIFFAVFFISIIACASSIGESDEVYLAVKRVPNDAVITQGRPGKQGVAGPIGPAGAKGEKGDVGRCTCDLSEVMELKQQIQALRDQILPDEGWFAPGNGHQYIVTSSKQNWRDSRALCQRMGGDLATVGMRNHHTRFIIGRAIQHGRATWIGLNDIANEGTFVWIDGVTATSENIDWAPGQPSDVTESIRFFLRQPEDARRNEDCGEISGSSRSFQANDERCSELWNALCEKRLG